MGDEYINNLLGSNMRILIGLFFINMFKDTLISIISGIFMFIGHELNVDDNIFISGRPARVVRVGVLNTIFFMKDSMCKMRVPNTELKHLIIEKVLPENGEPYIKGEHK